MVFSCPKCNKGVITSSSINCPTCGYTATANDFVKYIQLPKRRPFFYEEFAVGTILLLLVIGTILAAIFGVDGGFSFGIILFIIIAGFFAFISFYVGLGKLRNARTLYDQYHKKPDEYKMILANIEYTKGFSEHVEEYVWFEVGRSFDV